MLLNSPLKKVICSFEEQCNEDNVDKNVYLFESKRTCKDNAVICTLSNGQIKLYDIQTLQNTGVFNGTISNNDIQGYKLLSITNLDTHPSNDNIFGVSYEDGHARLYDRREPQNVNQSNNLSSSVLDIKNNYTFDTSQPMQCLTFGFDGNLLASGVANTIEFYDLRYLKNDCSLGTYSDAHNDDITRLLFHPTQANILASSGEDGLVCIYDTSVGTNINTSTNENISYNNSNNSPSSFLETSLGNDTFIGSSKEEPLQCIINADCPVRHTEFFG